MSWEDTFLSWASPPSQTEQDKCDNAERAVAKAVAASTILKRRGITVYTQGSYRNRTNVRLESDVDIGILCEATFYYDLPAGATAQGLGISPATYSYRQYKDEVERALIDHLGSPAVVRGNKAFDVHENTYRVDADVVACFPYRWYQPNGTYIEGRAFDTDSGVRVINYSEQNYANGVAKNDRTKRNFKANVRILKRLLHKMADDRIAAAKAIPPYLLECLAWNVSDEGFMHSNYTADVRYVLAHTFNHTRTIEECQFWCEINDIKYLFRPGQPWTLEVAHRFLSEAWDYVGFD
jgi:hypothetical protein